MFGSCIQQDIELGHGMITSSGFKIITAVGLGKKGLVNRFM